MVAHTCNLIIQVSEIGLGGQPGLQGEFQASPYTEWDSVYKQCWHTETSNKYLLDRYLWCNQHFIFFPFSSLNVRPPLSLSSYLSLLYFWNSLQTLISKMCKVCRTNWLMNKHSYAVDREPGACQCDEDIGGRIAEWGGDFSFVVRSIRDSAFANSSLATGLPWPHHAAAMTLS